MDDSNLQQLTILYNSMLLNVRKLKKLITSGDYEEIRNIMIDRAKIMQSIKAFKNSYNKKLPKELDDIGELIKNEEKENIIFLERRRAEVGQEIAKLKAKEHISNAYSLVNKSVGRLLDKQDDKDETIQ